MKINIKLDFFFFLNLNVRKKFHLEENEIIFKRKRKKKCNHHAALPFSECKRFNKTQRKKDDKKEKIGFVKTQNGEYFFFYFL